MPSFVDLVGGKPLWIIGGLLLALTAIGGGVLYVQHLQNVADEQAATIRTQAAENAAQARNEGALENAATTRADDTATIAASKKERDDAISKAPTSAPGAATLRANCMRWKAQHPREAAPAPCR